MILYTASLAKRCFATPPIHFQTFEFPDVNRGRHRFEPVTDKVIRYGLGAIKGTGQQAIEAIVAAREEGGEFKSLYDFCLRVDRTKLNKRTLEALIKAGAFDNLQRNRAALVATIDQAFAFANVSAANANQHGLFDMEDSHASSTQEPDLVEATPWGIKEQLVFEKTAIGFYLSGHLFDEVAREVRQFVKRGLGDLIDTREPQLFAGIVTDLRVINGQRGKLALFKLDDKSGAIDARADEALINQHKDTLKDDEMIVVMGKLMPDRFSGGLQMTVQQIWDLAGARCRFGKFLRIKVDRTNGHKPPAIAQLLQDYPAKTEMSEHGELQRGLPLRLSMMFPGFVAEDVVRLEDRRCFPTDAALAGLRAQAHEGQATVVYE